MLIFIDYTKANFSDNIDYFFGFRNEKEYIIQQNKEILVFKLKSLYTPLLKREIKKMKSELVKMEDVKLVLSDNTPQEIKDEFDGFHKIQFSDTLIKNLHKIIRMISKNEFLEILIVSSQRDDTIFEIIDPIKDRAKTFTIITDDLDFFSEIEAYTLKNYGITTTLKKFEDIKNKDVAIVSNSHNKDFKNKALYTIDMNENQLYNTNMLFDYCSDLTSEIKNFQSKLCYFVEKNDTIINLLWKFSKKS